MSIIKDYITGQEIDVTHKPEEIVRQNYLKVLHEEYGYPIEHLAKEVPIKDGTSEVVDVVTGAPKRADII